MKKTEKQKTELTDDDLRQLDKLHNAIYFLLCDVCPNPKKKDVPWDMEYIGEIAEIVENFAVTKKLCTAQEVNPYIEV
jgi:hypothetical protein